MIEHKTIGHVETLSEPHVQWVAENHALGVAVTDNHVVLEGYRLTPYKARQLAALLTAGAALIAEVRLADETNPPPSWRQQRGQL